MSIKDDGKRIEFKLDAGKLLITVDSNDDGEPLLVVSLDLTEVPDEVLSLFKKG